MNALCELIGRREISKGVFFHPLFARTFPEPGANASRSHKWLSGTVGS